MLSFFFFNFSHKSLNNLAAGHELLLHSPSHASGSEFGRDQYSSNFTELVLGLKETAKRTAIALSPPNYPNPPPPLFFLTRDGTGASRHPPGQWKLGVLTTGPPGNSLQTLTVW